VNCSALLKIREDVAALTRRELVPRRYLREWLVLRNGAKLACRDVDDRKARKCVGEARFTDVREICDSFCE
jgi:hypothetical protein